MGNHQIDCLVKNCFKMALLIVKVSPELHKH